MNPGDIIEGVIENIGFTCNSPFGEQRTTIKDDEGNLRSIATWIDFRHENHAKTGDRVRVTVGKDKESHTGFGGKIILRNVAHKVEKI